MSKVTTPDFRAAFPAVFEARLNKMNQKLEFSIVALFPADTDLKAMKMAAKEACIKKWGKDPSVWPTNLKSPFKDQGDRAKIDKETGKKVLPQGYVAGNIYVNFKSNQRPGVVDRNVQKIIDTSEFYGGCWAKASVNAFAYDTAGNQGVSFGLGNLQKVKDDSAFGNRTKPEDDFAPVASPDGANNKSADAMFS